MEASAYPRFLSLLLFTVLLGLAEESSAVFGTVVDPGGFPLPRATIRLSASDPERQYEGYTEGNGHFRFKDVPPGAYKITIALQGFQSSIHEVRISLGVDTDIGVQHLAFGPCNTPGGPICDDFGLPHSRRAGNAGGATPVASVAVIDVCEALQRIDVLNGSVVAVRGFYRFAMELGGLYGRNCPKKLVLDGVERAQAFDLEFGPTVADKDLAAVVNRLIREKNSREAIQVTVVGTIHARRTDSPDINGRKANGQKARMFGHLGVYPAQIAVQSIRDISVLDLPEFPSNMQPKRRF
jgi:hypothetical protein